jgi:antitoxin component YwqK of YwqJK toxin-antitoxin module
MIYNYINGVRNGEYKTYNNNGELLFICNYIDDEIKQENIEDIKT